MDSLEARMAKDIAEIRGLQTDQFDRLVELIGARGRTRSRSTRSSVKSTVDPTIPLDPTAALEARLRTLELNTALAGGTANQNAEARDPADIDVYAERPADGYPAATVAAMIERVHSILPRAKAPDQVDGASRPDSNLKKQIRWTANHNISSIEDPRILPKVQEVEDELLESLVPYRVWPQRIIPLLRNDFQVIRSYLEHNPTTTWIETLALIGHRLHSGSNLRAPWYTWIHLHPKQGELQLGYAQRIRDAFYGLSRLQQREPQTREHLVRLIRDAFATVWGDIQYHQRSLRIAELIDDLVSRTLNNGRRPIETAVFTQPTIGTTLQGANDPFPSVQLIPGSGATQDRAVLEYLPVQNPAAAALPGSLTVPKNENIIADPRTDDQTVSYAQGSTRNSASNALAVGNGNCHNCGKPGHWAKDCRQPQQARRGGFRGGHTKGGMPTYDRGRAPEGESVTITGTLTGRMARVFNAAKRPFQSSGRGGSRGRSSSRGSNNNRGGRRQYAITDDEFEIQAMDYGVTTDNPAMVNDLLNADNAWDDYNTVDYDEDYDDIE
jgi:hypothetical protein